MADTPLVQPRRITRFGWNPDLPDVRDFAYAAPPDVVASLPPMVDLRPKCPPVVDQGDLGSCTANAYAAGLKDLALQYKRVTRSLAQMKGCLASGFPFVFGFTVYESFEADAVAKSGIVPMPKRGEGVLGGHAVLAVGYDDSTQRFTVRNSWGDGWGQAGYFEIPYRYLSNRKLASDYWTVRLTESAA